LPDPIPVERRGAVIPPLIPRVVVPLVLDTDGFGKAVLEAELTGAGVEKERELPRNVGGRVKERGLALAP